MNPAEFNNCVDKYANNLYRFIFYNIKDKEKAKDIVQDTFEKLWLKCPEIDISKARSWMFITAYRLMIDLIRKDNKQQRINETDFESFKYEKSYSDLQEILHKALNNLPVDQKSVVLLRDYEGYSYEEISDITGLSKSQVKVYIFRARTYLKKYIGNTELVI